MEVPLTLEWSFLLIKRNCWSHLSFIYDVKQFGPWWDTTTWMRRKTLVYKVKLSTKWLETIENRTCRQCNTTYVNLLGWNISFDLSDRVAHADIVFKILAFFYGFESRVSCSNPSLRFVSLYHWLRQGSCQMLKNEGTCTYQCRGLCVVMHISRRGNSINSR